MMPISKYLDLSYFKESAQPCDCMAATKDQLLRCRIIDQELSSKARVKSKSIQKILSERYDLEVTLRTIQKDIEAMCNDSRFGFFAPIEYDPKKKAYYYTDPNFSLQKFNLTDEELNSLHLGVRAIKAYSDFGVFKIFGDAIKKVEDGIRIEKGINIVNREVWDRVIIGQMAVPINDSVNLVTLIIKAMDQKKIIRFLYKKFTDSIPVERKCIPAWIREYKGL